MFSDAQKRDASSRCRLSSIDGLTTKEQCIESSKVSILKCDTAPYVTCEASQKIFSAFAADLPRHLGTNISVPSSWLVRAAPQSTGATLFDSPHPVVHPSLSSFDNLPGI